MATYAIGDVQGCYDALQRLLDAVRFDRGQDRLWFAGDLVNRGPDSLSALRFVKGLGDSAITVLGNHDIHLLCRAAHVVGAKKNDTLDDVLGARDGADLVAWLRAQPLMHCEGHYVLIHAGLLPQWSITQAAAFADEVSRTIRSEESADFLRYHISHNLTHWPEGGGFARLSFILNALTRLRVCSARGKMELTYSGPLAGVPKGFRPWFTFRAPQASEIILFGHWAALGFHSEARAVCLDSGCVWGGQLTAMRLEDRRVFQVPSTAAQP